MGYGERQISELAETIAATDCDIVLVATPIDLRRVLKIDKPSMRVRYELQEIGLPDLGNTALNKIEWNILHFKIRILMQNSLGIIPGRIAIHHDQGNSA